MKMWSLSFVQYLTAREEMKHLHTASLYARLWFLWSVHSIQSGDSCDTMIQMEREERQVGLGHSFTLSCRFSCVRPSDDLHWLKNGQSVANTTTDQSNFNFSLRIDAAEPQHSGKYHCQTQGASSNTVVIRVVDLSVRVSSAAVEVLEGDTVELSCTPASPLNATLFWAQGECEENRTVSQHRTLRISPVTIQHNTDYHCCCSIPTSPPLHRSQRVQVTVLRLQSILSCQLLWYLLCKAGIFLLLLATVIIILACRGHC
ncbi:hypothetical protein AGOR_G00236610 [Albula goreensis]|uniref:Ig-like domain-containing protein n=1 Tax=Albula goreensis TaxID=1534307 RepID=A0A8T3CIS4_9TELE|nr:hypothetical protein AGOR_G00236610 [Albula goreensis]